MKETVRSVWKFFVEEAELGLDTPMDVYYFGSTKDVADSLSELVVKGVKRGTTSAVWEYEHYCEDFPKQNEYSIITDFEGEPKCIIRTTNVLRLNFNEVDERLALIEGEGDKSLEYWRRVHKDIFTKILPSIGKEFNDSMPIVFEEFETVYVCQ